MSNGKRQHASGQAQSGDTGANISANIARTQNQTQRAGKTQSQTGGTASATSASMSCAQDALVSGHAGKPDTNASVGNSGVKKMADEGSGSIGLNTKNTSNGKGTMNGKSLDNGASKSAKVKGRDGKGANATKARTQGNASGVSATNSCSETAHTSTSDGAGTTGTGTTNGTSTGIDNGGLGTVSTDSAIGSTPTEVVTDSSTADTFSPRIVDGAHDDISIDSMDSITSKNESITTFSGIDNGSNGMTSAESVLGTVATETTDLGPTDVDPGASSGTVEADNSAASGPGTTSSTSTEALNGTESITGSSKVSVHTGFGKPSVFGGSSGLYPSSSYRLSSQLSDEDVPLLMRFMHKPLRALQELERASDPTRRNLLINAGLGLERQRLAALAASRGSDDDHPYRLVRKKSGEIVKPLLKDSGAILNRSRSLPLTPTYKLVHFGGDADVRYFSQRDKPTAISAQNSPTLESQDDNWTYNGDLSEESEYGFRPGAYDLYDEYYDDELSSRANPSKIRSEKAHYPRVTWLLQLEEFPRILYQEKIMLRHMPVFMEQAFISVDKRYLLGQIAVRNLLYEKTVLVRYTHDGWATIVELPTVWVPDPPAVLRTHDYDRFVFKIPLDELMAGAPDSEDGVRQRVFEMCVRYSTPSVEYWDNNDLKNYRFRITRKENHISGGAGSTSTMPSGARSKQQAHSRKPKYSSSYLKRVVSEPTLDKHDDFEENNYYLLSPLLLSLRTTDFRAVDTPSPVTSDVAPELLLRPDSVLPEMDVAGSPRPTTHKRMDAMSYKELLDSYCFFLAPAGDTSSTTTLVLSDEPAMRYDNDRQDCGGDDTAFTVLSFLR